MGSVGAGGGGGGGDSHPLACTEGTHSLHREYIYIGSRLLSERNVCLVNCVFEFESSDSNGRVLLTDTDMKKQPYLKFEVAN